MIFKRNKFFPNLSTSLDSKRTRTEIGLSLGLLKVHSKVKKQSKQAFIKLAEFLKRVLLSLEKLCVIINIKGTPKFLKDILLEIMKKSNKLIFNPITESPQPQSVASATDVVFSKIHYYKTFSYVATKSKKLGRVKRKIRRKILAVNNVID